jgi:hypothetical protein
VPSSLVQTVPSSNLAYLTIPGTITIPSSWSSPVVVATSAISSLTVGEFVTISSGVAIISFSNIPCNLPTSLVLTPPSTVRTVYVSSYVFAPATAVVPTSWSSPVVVPISWVSSVPSS